MPAEKSSGCPFGMALASSQARASARKAASSGVSSKSTGPILEHVLVLAAGRGLLREGLGQLGLGRRARRVAALPQRGEEALDALDHPGGAGRREDLERVLRALHLGVGDRLLRDARGARSTKARASSTGASVSRSPWITKNGGASAWTWWSGDAVVELLGLLGHERLHHHQARGTSRRPARSRAERAVRREVVDAVERHGARPRWCRRPRSRAGSAGRSR